METFKKHRLAKDIIICADGGANHIYKTGVKPDMIVGDLDSIDDETLLYYQEQNVLFHKFSSKKDLTDTELAINFALEEGANELVLFGSTGSRLDHTLGNIMLLYKLLKQPYDEQPEFEKWFAKRPDWARNKIGCSMLSCSS